MTSIDFYFNADDRLQVACRLAGKALKQRQRLLIYAPGGDAAARVDRMLWTTPATGFVPHCDAHHALAAETPVLIDNGVTAGSDAPPGCEVLLNLGTECPPHFERFARLLEIVATDEEGKQQGRSRYRFYVARGYRIASHDLAQSHE